MIFYCENPTRSTNVHCGQKVEYFSVERGDARNSHQVSNGYMNVEAKRLNILFSYTMATSIEIT